MNRNRSSRAPRAVVTAVGIAALLTALGWVVVSRWPRGGRPAATGHEPSGSRVRHAALSLLGLGEPRARTSMRSLQEALAYCDQGLARARATAATRPSDPMAHLRVASLETRRSSLLALLTYERRSDPRAVEADRDYLRFRSHYLQQDPDRTLTRAAHAARTALRVDGSPTGAPMPPRSRREAYLLLAMAHKSLGDPSSEARALAAAADREPGRTELWLRLADAYARARRFSRAEAAMARAVGEER